MTVVTDDLDKAIREWVALTDGQRETALRAIEATPRKQRWVDLDDPATFDQLAAALHESAPHNHNLGEGWQRAICDSPDLHRRRADAILAALRVQP